MSAQGTLNQVTLIGRLGRDPEARTTQSGSTVCQIAVATVESIKDRSTDQWTHHTDWHRIVIFGHTAKYLGDYARKGHRVLVTGLLRTRKWQDKNGNDQYTTEIIASDVQILERKDSSQAPAEPNATASKPQSSDFDDDIPF